MATIVYEPSTISAVDMKISRPAKSAPDLSLKGVLSPGEYVDYLSIESDA